MKTFFRILLFVLFVFSVHAQQTITVTLTVTNTPVNGNTISVNGFVWTWTNTVTAANNQIQTTNTISASALNALYAFALYPFNGVNVYQYSADVIVLQANPGSNNAVAVTGTWASLVTNIYGSTNLASNMISFRGSATVVGPDELTNTANGIVSYVGSSAVTNPIPESAPAMSNFAGLSFSVLTAHDNTTNFWLNFFDLTYNTILATGDVCFTIPTNGPGKTDVLILPNGANRNILWPTNFITINTNGLIFNGTNWQMTLTNDGYRVAYCSFIAFTNAPNDTNVIAMCSTSAR